MNVSFAVQVLSRTVAYLLKNYYDEKTYGTAKLSEYIDKMFDYLIVRNHVEGVKKRKSFPQTYINWSAFQKVEKWFLKVPTEPDDEYLWQTRQFLSDWEGQNISKLGNLRV